MIRVTDIKVNIDSSIEDLKNKIKKNYKIKEIIKLEIVKKAIDARDNNNILFVYTVDIEINNEYNYLIDNEYKNISRVVISEDKIKKVSKEPNKRPIIVGSGPAGLFCALTLVESGIKPIIIERGRKVEQRIEDIEKFKKTRKLNVNSNIQFGEGGAGTFSDGKLTTGIKDKRISKVMTEFIKFGANEEIKYWYKPHIGTDVLIEVVRNIREYLIDKGTIIRFDTKLTDILIEKKKVVGIEVNSNEIIDTDELILAIGNSARDTFELLHDLKVKLEQKNFAVGLRIEHLQETFNKNQYGKYYNHKNLTSVDYKLVHHSENGRTAYSFCVCPGGYVMAATSEEGVVVTNGMSEYKRDNKNINGALLVNVNEKDFKSKHPLAGMYFQRELEKSAFILGGSNYNAPIQRVEDFINNKKTEKIGSIIPSYLPNTTMCNFNSILPSFILETLKEAIEVFGKRIKGFDNKDAILTGIETRSSSPIRIVRNDNLESINIKGLYPIGEGSGYAGGITSSAVDGIKVAKIIIDKYI